MSDRLLDEAIIASLLLEDEQERGSLEGKLITFLVLEPAISRLRRQGLTDGDLLKLARAIDARESDEHQEDGG